VEVGRDDAVLAEATVERAVAPVWPLAAASLRGPTAGFALQGRDTIARMGALDLLDIDSMLAEGELAERARIRRFVQAELQPHVDEWFAGGEFPGHLPRAFGELGVLGMHLHGYGCAGASAVEYGLACMEIEACDSGLRTFVSVQGSLAMTAISEWGSDAQKQEWLPSMAAGEAVGCFALTEAEAGSDPASLQTGARRSGGDWVLDGSKRWIGLGSIAQVAVVWAQTDEGIRGFLVPTDTPGFSARDITNKLSMRASIQCDLRFEDCRIPGDAILASEGLRGPFTSLNEARYGIAWGAMGAARSCLESALGHSQSRSQFDQPIAGFQLTQRKLVDMTLELEKGTLLALHLGRMKDAGRLSPEHISAGKLNNVREALAIARQSRTILGGEGITDDFPVMRHMANLEAVRTYEGTDEVHTLILGNAITGVPAFRAAPSA
jgi:glutaryl-CoA dehydrogenase